MDAGALGVALAVIFGVTLIVGHCVLFPILHRAVGLGAHLAIRLADTFALAIGWVAAGWLVPMSSGAVWFWDSGEPAMGQTVLGLCVLWFLLVWLVPPGPVGEEAPVAQQGV